MAGQSAEYTLKVSGFWKTKRNYHMWGENMDMQTLNAMWDCELCHRPEKNISGKTNNI